ncbi:hypothetical protein TIFTF001_019417 [Ficus carica]|uniref:Ninja-family protein n=1 Tax=Ficus carica TaxID=3494 RepID=A0AA88ADF5_FICCA|nr:hypothetical protein TIFTF001_019417 [Ficus carica]
MTMVEVSEMIRLKEEELELELGLSIGSSFRKLSETPKLVERESGFQFDSRSNGFHLDMKESQTTPSTSRSSTTSPTAVETECAVLDLKTKREIHALRRQEAKKKQKEKRSRGRNIVDSSDSLSVLEDHQPASKKEKTEGTTVNGSERTEFNGVGNGNFQIPNPSNGQTVHYPVVAVQYPYAPVQFVQYANGFAYPCVVPCWPASPGGNEKSVFQQVACRGFRPFLAQPSLGLSSLSNECQSEKGGGKDGEIGKTASFDSPVCSSSTISDHHNSSSHEGDGSSETRTHSSHSSPEQNRRDSPNSNDTKREARSSCSHQTEHVQNNAELKEEVKPAFESAPLEKPISTTENRRPNSLKETKTDIGKPPRPQSLTRNVTPPPTALPQMPYVSTRGDGPNGKTVRGFLYRYTNSEVSIVCVCHGSTFSPAEFVQHAGGTDVSHPLKHITVIPSAFC